ncbi:MAG TPA: RNA 3'-terminal phosphate cyclase [Candidatus Bilamarchaeaceae archaeon]|nr:RNA 3'-terminal phosphate cyclase [Candidatus Bilamarchaeaceae archaeon]
MIEIDCSEGEGGGQIIRTALTLSSITQKPIRLFNIRAKRPNPGLAAQHLTCARSVRKICRGQLEHDELGSTDLIFYPGKIVGGKYDFNIGTAGSVTLVAQTVIPILLFADKPSEIKIIGGTHVMKSPGYDYFEHVFIPAINSIGAKVSSKLIKSGFYPSGGGEISITIAPSTLSSKTTWESAAQTRAIIRLSNIPLLVAIREKKIFLNNNITWVNVIEEKTRDPANSVTVFNGFRGSYVLGEKGKRAEVVAQESVNELNHESQVDKHLADQILLYLCLASGNSSFSTSQITDHFKSNGSIIQKFLDKKIDFSDNLVRISCEIRHGS